MVEILYWNLDNEDLKVIHDSEKDPDQSPRLGLMQDWCKMEQSVSCKKKMQILAFLRNNYASKREVSANWSLEHEHSNADLYLFQNVGNGILHQTQWS